MEEVNNVEYSEKEFIEVIRFIGKNYRYIKHSLRDEMIAAWGKTMMVKPIQSNKDEKGRTIATTRLLHYSNTAYIAFKIAEGLYPNDKEFALGVSVCALYHDIGQPPYGHDGEVALKFASENNNGGPMLHNIEGARKILQRHSNKIINAINSGKIIEDVAEKRNIPKEEIKRRIEMGLEPELNEKINEMAKINGDLPKEVVKVIAMSAGNHNGERGTGNITPNNNRTFEEFFDIAKKTYINAKEDKNMEACNIVDAIVKISDQISSIPFDIIDAKRAGIEDKIFEGWAEPISKILNITEDEAIRKLEGNNNELKKLAIELQMKCIESVIKSSDKNQIKMDLAPLLYGVTDEKGQTIINGLRTYNMSEHTAYTSTAESEVLLNNMITDLTDKLATAILDEKRAFPSDLNEVFRLSLSNPTRRTKEKILINNFNKDEIYSDFYKYAVETSPEEYETDKKIVQQREVQYYREIIEKSLDRRTNILENIESRSPRNSIPYLIEEYILSPSYEAMIPDERNKYSDEEIKKMLDRINTFLSANPVGGIERLSLLVQRYKYQIGIDGAAEKVQTGKIKMNTDQQIAARIALGYIGELSDQQLIDLATSTGVLTEEQRKVFTERPYSEYGKRTGRPGHTTKSMKYAMGDYNESLNNNGREL